ncbi:hypothetical protein [Nereida sp. MMG025]|uniref:hypothetical protein n=1 Tax=Nereida sp. MMG025 TaxID=2909981 RepID=UPI001F3CA901|nr:hypothetical protein [Nereida sp. MMG025]MCF6443630.1 hypothetical protein [Nereida sp. MMG025]
MTQTAPLFPDLPEPLVDRYRRLSGEVLPRLARTKARHWPICEDHCFQRVVLDHVCGGRWYDHIKRPAYKHLSTPQAARAVALCEQIIDGTADLWALNRQSLIWRGKGEGG